MNIKPELDVTSDEHAAITALRNEAFPDHQVARSYYKQLPHMRALEYKDERLVGYLGLDYRVIGVGEYAFKVLGVIDFCVAKAHQGQGIGSAMLSQLSEYSKSRDVDFIVLVSDLTKFYTDNGFRQIHAPSAWLRLHEHKNFGVAFEHLDDLFIKPISGKHWESGQLDWLGYMF
ncbi:GNAT family N-acetyltransferase [Photobacterium halotolerans]|uniref:GNAT family N-acetyltransferase n=1 Tax=Photobacterium halotolerans TaxID=265726 RepID=UPI001372BB9F|nr:GNAT family N-acetyltransferase [Photobacterium halotolerans]